VTLIPHDTDVLDDPRLLQIHRPVPQRDVPYLPTDHPVVDAMLDLARLTPDDVLYDLGCGDGRIVIEAARRGARAIGVDIDITRLRECQENRRRAGVDPQRARFLRRSFFDVDLREATVVALYLLPGINVKLRPKLLFELRPGARVVANYFEIGDWQPDEIVNVHRRTLMKWVIPAWVAGRWHGTLVHADGSRGHMNLELHRRYQRVWGTARVGGREHIALTDATLIGDELTFTLYHYTQMRPPHRFHAKLADGQLRGTFQSTSRLTPSRPGGWWALRVGEHN
jgi:precorrin-6B methylase 2